MERESDLIVRALGARWWVIVLLVVSSLVAARVFTASQAPVYRVQTSSTVIPSAQVKEPAELLRSLETLERRTLVATFAMLAGSRATRQEAMTNLELTSADVAGYRVSAAVAPNTNVIRIVVEGSDGARASDLANAVAQVTAKRASELYRMYTLQPLDASIPAEAPAYPNGKRNAVVAAIIGLFLGLAGAVGLEVLALSAARANRRGAARAALVT
jgi:capsular polysaccharide biosynthesis protein